MPPTPSSQRTLLGAHRISTEGISVTSSLNVLEGQAPQTGNDQLRVAVASAQASIAAGLVSQAQAKPSPGLPAKLLRRAFPTTAFHEDESPLPAQPSFAASSKSGKDRTGLTIGQNNRQAEEISQENTYLSDSGARGFR